MTRPITVTPRELARVRFNAWARTWNDTKTFDELTENGQKAWLREAENQLAEIKANRKAGLPS